MLLALLALALAGGWALAAAGRPWAAAAWVAACVLANPAVLALEFALLRWAHGSDPCPRASASQLLRAWAHEAVAAPVVFGWRQPFRSRAIADHLPTHLPDPLVEPPAGRRGVLLVHGFVCNRGIWNPWMQRLRAQGTPFVAVNLEPVFGGIDDFAPTIERAVQRLHAATQCPPVVVAHSMGGLAVRAWWAQPDRQGRIHHLITLGTPHQGTWLARLAFSLNGRQMQMQSGWLRALQAREPLDRALRITCLYSHCDNIVFPPSQATLPGSQAHHVPAHAHVHLVSHPLGWALLQARLAG